METNIRGRKYDEKQDVCMSVSPHETLNTARGTVVTLRWKAWQTAPDPGDQSYYSSNLTHGPHGPSAMRLGKDQHPL